MLSNLFFLNRHFKKSKTSKSDRSQKKDAEFKAPKMKKASVIQNTGKGFTTPPQKRKTPNDCKGKVSQKAKKKRQKRFKTSTDYEDYEEKDLVDSKMCFFVQ